MILVFLSFVCLVLMWHHFINTDLDLSERRNDRKIEMASHTSPSKYNRGILLSFQGFFFFFLGLDWINSVQVFLNIDKFRPSFMFMCKKLRCFRRQTQPRFFWKLRMLEQKKNKLESNWDLGFGSGGNSWFGFKGGGNKLFQLNKKNPSIGRNYGSPLLYG